MYSPSRAYSASPVLRQSVRGLAITHVTWPLLPGRVVSLAVGDASTGLGGFPYCRSVQYHMPHAIAIACPVSEQQRPHCHDTAGAGVPHH
jgi:hypothetical protein